MAGYFPSSDHHRLRYPNIYGKAIRQNSNKKKKGLTMGTITALDGSPTQESTIIASSNVTQQTPTNRSNQVNNVLPSIIIHITQGRHGLSLNLDHINTPTQNTNWSTRSLGKEKKKKKKPTDTPQKCKKHTDGNDNMKSIPTNKLPHHLRTRSGGAKARNFRQTS